MAVWISSLLVWTSLMSTHHANPYRPYGFLERDYVDDTGEDYSVTARSHHQRRPGELVFAGRSLAADSHVQKVEKKKETQRRTGTSSLLLLLLDGIVNEVKTTLGDEVVFPGPTKSQSPFVPVVPSECRKLGICEDAERYPLDHVNELLKSRRNYSFNVDELETPAVAVVQRVGAPDEEEMCASTERIIRPKIAQNKENKWYYIVNNADTAPLQGFRGEVCYRDRSQCSQVPQFPSGYEGICVQKYMLRFMYAFDEKGAVFQDSFRVPSCCSCVVKILNYN